MKISIIIVNSNNRVGLKKTVESVVAQTFSDYELIIINNDSAEDAYEWIKKYDKKVSLWIDEPEKGVFRARNKGLDASHGEYLLFLHSGDILCDENVLLNVVPLLNDKDLYLASIADNDVESMNDKEPDICSALVLTPMFDRLMIARREVFDEYGKYREDISVLSEWWLLYNAVILNNASVERLPRRICIHDCRRLLNIDINMIESEREKLLSDYPRVRCIDDFYRDNYEILNAMTSSRLSFFVFRVYYYFYRKFMWIAYRQRI